MSALGTTTVYLLMVLAAWTFALAVVAEAPQRAQRHRRAAEHDRRQDRQSVDEDQVGHQECRAAVLPQAHGKHPEVAQAHGRAGTGQHEAEVRAETVAFGDDDGGSLAGFCAWR